MALKHVAIQIQMFCFILGYNEKSGIITVYKKYVISFKNLMQHYDKISNYHN